MIQQVRGGDGSYTAYSEAFGEHYHSTKEGALYESLYKHVLPAMRHTQEQKHIRILDICFGLGFNTLATLWYLQKEGIKKSVRILSPEIDRALVRSLVDFPYPKELQPFMPIIESIAKTGEYRDDAFHISVIFGDAREILLTCNERFDIVYHDAFSPKNNPTLWTLEYFTRIGELLEKEGLLTTYSTALRTRLALYRCGFDIYLNEGERFRTATLAARCELPYKKVDMEHKIACNAGVAPLTDANIAR